MFGRQCGSESAPSPLPVQFEPDLSTSITSTVICPASRSQRVRFSPLRVDRSGPLQGAKRKETLDKVFRVPHGAQSGLIVEEIAVTNELTRIAVSDPPRAPVSRKTTLLILRDSRGKVRAVETREKMLPEDPTEGDITRYGFDQDGECRLDSMWGVILGSPWSRPDFNECREYIELMRPIRGRGAESRLGTRRGPPCNDPYGINHVYALEGFMSDAAMAEKGAALRRIAERIDATSRDLPIVQLEDIRCPSGTLISKDRITAGNVVHHFERGCQEMEPFVGKPAHSSSPAGPVAPPGAAGSAGP